MFGEILKEIRKNNGDSLRKLAEKLNTSFSYIDRIEREEVPASKNILEKLLEVYPLQKEKLIKSYCDDLLPNEAKKYTEQKEQGFVDDIVSLIENLDKNNKKIILNGIIEKLEYISLKNGKYEDVKDMLENAKTKTEKL